MRWLLGLDVGTNSIGWWAYEITKNNKVTRSIDGGVRLFPDGREPSSRGRVGDSLAVSRRMARGMRRNREHRQLRMSKLTEALIGAGLLPENDNERKALFQTPSKTNGDPLAWDPYRLRAKAAKETVTPHELGRALFHLGLRRGYKSNRKEASDDEGGKLKERMASLDSKLAGHTLGEYLWKRLREESNKPAHGSLEEKPLPIRFSDGNPFFANRGMYQTEFEKIRSVQKDHHALSEDDWDKLKTYILEQRPLKPVDRGRCEFFASEPRHWKDTPIGHDFRIYQELNNLRVTSRDDLEAHNLTNEQYDTVLNALMTQKSISFGGMRKLSDAGGNRLFPRNSTFNLESKKRKDLKGHRIAVDMQNDPILRSLWERYQESGTLDRMFEVLFEKSDDEEAIDTLRERFELRKEEAEALARLSLGRATGNLSLKAMEQLVSIMRDQGLPYYDAVSELHDDNGNRLHHSMRETRKFRRLPYYGEVMPEKMLGADSKFPALQSPEKHFGRINNPTVHVALNQIRKLVNTLADRFESAPVKIHVEMTRELKNSKKAREEMESQQGQNEKRNKAIRDDLKTEHGFDNPSARDIKKRKLWEELGKGKFERPCPFTGENIAANQLFNGEVEIEHILPFSRTLDDSLSNLTLAFRWANSLKGNQTPYEAFASGQYENRNIIWGEIFERANNLPKNKSWRFGKNAMERFEKDKDNDFIARQLSDTAYIARTTKRYLEAMEGVEDTVMLPGRLTAMIRGKWGLNGILSDSSDGNKKSRDDHRHHAVDAAVIGLIDRSLLQQISTLSGRGADDRLYIRLPDLKQKIESAIRDRVPTILPSFKPDHGLEGKMFEETAYGFTDEVGEVVTRKPLEELTLSQIRQIRDDKIRTALEEQIAANPDPKIREKRKNNPVLKKLLADFGLDHGIKRTRIVVTDQTVKPVPTAPYKGYQPDSYACCDIWALPPKRKGGKATYKGVFWLYSEVETDDDTGKPHIDKNRNKPHPAARYMTRVFKDDLIEVGALGSGDIYRVAGFSTTNNKLDVRAPCSNETKQIFKAINILGQNGLHRLYVTPDGRVLRRGKQ